MSAGLSVVVRLAGGPGRVVDAEGSAGRSGRGWWVGRVVDADGSVVAGLAGAPGRGIDADGSAGHGGLGRWAEAGQRCSRSAGCGSPDQRVVWVVDVGRSAGRGGPGRRAEASCQCRQVGRLRWAWLVGRSGLSMPTVQSVAMDLAGGPDRVDEAGRSAGCGGPGQRAEAGRRCRRAVRLATGSTKTRRVRSAVTTPVPSTR